MKMITLTICILGIGLVHGMGERFIENPGPHGGEISACAGSRLEINRHMKEVKCMPRKSLVKLRPEPGYAFSPNIVSVNKCSGLCSNNLSCMPIESLLRPVLVRRHHIKSNDPTCYRAYVEEHTKCKCKCNVMEKDCNKNQVYIDDDCVCKCMNFEDQLQCSLLPGMIWNPEKCKCTCVMQEEECSTGLEWIPSRCRCGKVMADTE